MTRKRPLVHFSLSPEAIRRLAILAEHAGETKSRMVEAMIRAAYFGYAHKEENKP
jgi:predicted DNA-binding protein